jgi:hypothetical protein
MPLAAFGGQAAIPAALLERLLMADFVEKLGTGPKQHCGPLQVEVLLLSKCPKIAG